ncbi:copper amine oxidase N-terminal domain-containing protein [Paenibacillus chitinolyticus]|uniref:copper amine oxidase N-terminal domain-containing protein n=1 Tax=Paenibacillus chitinolyticus TaxID=79263 RepID=UPI0036297AC8
MNNGMKKGLAVLAVSMAMTTGAAYASPAVVTKADNLVPISAEVSQSVQVTVNNQVLDAEGYVKAGAKEAMIPLRAVAEAIGMDLKWNQEDYSVELSKDRIWTLVKTGEDRYVLNKMYKPLGTAPELVDSKLYVPASFASEILHGTVNAQGSAVSISFNEKKENVVTKGVVTSVRSADGYKAVQIQGFGTAGLVLNVGDDTVFVTDKGDKLTFDQLALGQIVEAEHSMVMTMSLPPQTPTYKITVSGYSADAEKLLGTSGTVEEVRTDDNGSQSVTIKGQGLTEQSQSEIVLRLSDATEVVDKAGAKADKKALVKGAKVIGFYNGVMTKSLPPIGGAVKIVVDVEPEAAAAQAE